MINYELHITFQVNDIELFKSVCNEIGVKPIIIETENEDAFGQQVMISHRFKADDYKEEMNRVSRAMGEKIMCILREKIEREPGDTKDPNHVYYESHLRLKLPLGFDLTQYKSYIKDSGFHLSKNLFKKNETHQYQMLTLRRNDIDLPTFMILVNMMKSTLESLGMECDKIEVEECIYDNNIAIDNDWLKTK